MTRLPLVEANLDRRGRFEHRPRLQMIGEDLVVERADLKFNLDVDDSDGDHDGEDNGWQPTGNSCK